MTMEWLQRTLSVRPNTMNNAETPTASQKLCIFLLAKNNCLHYMKKINNKNLTLIKCDQKNLSEIENKSEKMKTV